MKRIIHITGILFLEIVSILNLLVTANLEASEHITITFNSYIYIIGLIIIGIFIYFLSIKINHYLFLGDSNKKKKIRKIIFFVSIAIYIVFNIVWGLKINPRIVGDSVHVCNLAQTFYRGNLEEFLPNMTYAEIPLSQYMQSYPQQVSLAFVYSLIFRIIHFDVMEILRVLNIICNLLIVIALYKINVQLSKKYETNKVLLLVFILTFVSLPMLLTFVYGDIPSLALCLFSVYFMMKYTETKKIKNCIIASILVMFAYMMRMNSLIFIIATVIYLLLNLLKGNIKIEWKEKLFDILMIIVYLAISIIPASLVKNYYLDKYSLNKNEAYPNISYFLMAMEESPRGNGWYNEEIAVPALHNPIGIQGEYLEKIKNRLTYFSENLGYTFHFYITKIASMWTENTYSAVRNNTIQENDPLEQMIAPLTFYQKALLILTCICSFIVLIQNRKNLSIELLFLITIFIGGFAFHIIWEAKSRYIIPYIVVLIPVASINIKRRTNE